MGTKSGTSAKPKPTRRTKAAPTPTKKPSKKTATPDSGTQGKAVRKSTLLSVDAVADLEAASTERGRTQRKAIELGLAMLVKHDQHLDAMQEFIEWSTTEFGEPTAEDHAWAQHVVANR